MKSKTRELRGALAVLVLLAGAVSFSAGGETNAFQRTRSTPIFELRSIAQKPGDPRNVVVEFAVRNTGPDPIVLDLNERLGVHFHGVDTQTTADRSWDYYCRFLSKPRFVTVPVGTNAICRVISTWTDMNDLRLDHDIRPGYYYVDLGYCGDDVARDRDWLWVVPHKLQGAGAARVLKLEGQPTSH